MPSTAFVISPQLGVLPEKLKSDEFEKTIPYMYVDTVGKITVGVGHNLTAKGDLLRLPFIVKRMERHSVHGGNCGLPITENRQVDRPATEAEIQNDYNFLAKHVGLGKFSAIGLAKYTTLELPPKAIEATFIKDLQDAADEAGDEFGENNFDHFPISCQAALIDIAFNCGGFKSFRSHLIPAIKGQAGFSKLSMADRWRTAASHCRRGAVNEVRNICVMQWFLQGAAECSTSRK